ncbi:MAG: hypothetical protein II824_06640 [Bacteroidales bacterium]|nr:hypothetical protein [Bacteroidales bacterium]
MCICKVRLQVGVLFLPVFHGGNDTQGDDFGGDPFYQVEAFTDLLFRGSPNQRIIYLHGAPPEDIIPDTVALEPLR